MLPKEGLGETDPKPRADDIAFRKPACRSDAVGEALRTTERIGASTPAHDRQAQQTDESSGLRGSASTAPWHMQSARNDDPSGNGRGHATITNQRAAEQPDAADDRTERQAGHRSVRS
jgi:hypothetical protein